MPSDCILASLLVGSFIVGDTVCIFLKEEIMLTHVYTGPIKLDGCVGFSFVI